MVRAWRRKVRDAGGWTGRAGGNRGRGPRFERFYADHYNLVLAYALRRTETREDAADVAAETFLTAWRRLDQAPAGRGRLRNREG